MVFFCTVVETSCGREKNQTDQELELKQSLPRPWDRSNCSIDRTDDHRSSSRNSRLDRPEERSSSRNSQLDGHDRRLSRCSQLEQQRSSRLDGGSRGSSLNTTLDRGSRGSSLNATLDRGSRGSSCDHSEIQVLTTAVAASTDAESVTRRADERLIEPASADHLSSATVTPSVQLGGTESPSRDTAVKAVRKHHPVNGSAGGQHTKSADKKGEERVTSSLPDTSSCASPGSGSTAGSGHSVHTRKG